MLKRLARLALNTVACAATLFASAHAAHADIHVGVTLSATGAAASLGWFTAYAMQGAAAVRTLGMVEVLFSYIVSRRLLGEGLSRREQCGVALMVLGLVLICWQAQIDLRW